MWSLSTNLYFTGIMSDHNGQLKRFMKSIHETLRHEESLNGLGLLNSAQVGDDQVWF